MAINREKRKINVKKSKLPKETKPDVSEITQSSDGGNGKKRSKLQLIKGSRRKNKILRLIGYGIVAALIITIIIVNALSPTGLIEQMQNGYATFGRGEFPVSLYAQNPTDFVSNGDVICAVNDSYFEVYNAGGELVQAVSHGMSKPCLEVSEARFLLFERDRYSIMIFNYSNELYSAAFDEVITSADIGRDGSYAVITGSKSFKNTVYVYDNDNDLKYTWNSANYYVLDVAVANDGDSIAVCLADALNGGFVSYIYILDFDSAEPKAKYEFDGLISSISSVNSEYIIANGSEKAYCVLWENAATTEIFNSGVIRHFAVSTDGFSAVVAGRSSNEQINTVYVLGEEGTITKKFGFNSRINNIAISESGIAVLSDNACHFYDINGGNERVIPTDVKGLGVCICEDNLYVADNSSIRRLD